MCHVENRNAGSALQILQLETHLLTQFRVEIAQRLVEQEHFGFLDQGSRQCNTLLFPTGKLTRKPIREPFETYSVQGIFKLRFYGSFGQLLKLQGIGDIVMNRHVRPDGVVLENHADGSKLSGHVDSIRSRVHAGPADVNFALARFFEPRDASQDRAFATTARPEQRKKFFVLDGKADGMRRDDLPVSLAQIHYSDLFHVDQNPVTPPVSFLITTFPTISSTITMEAKAAAISRYPASCMLYTTTPMVSVRCRSEEHTS